MGMVDHHTVHDLQPVADHAQICAMVHEYTSPDLQQVADLTQCWAMVHEDNLPDLHLRQCWATVNEDNLPDLHLRQCWAMVDEDNLPDLHLMQCWAMMNEDNLPELQAVADLNRRTGANVDPTADPSELMQSNTRNLMSAISSLPQLTERKKVLDKHTNIASALLKLIQGRALDQYYHREEDCLHGKADFAAITTLLQVS